MGWAHWRIKEEMLASIDLNTQKWITRKSHSHRHHFLPASFASCFDDGMDQLICRWVLLILPKILQSLPCDTLTAPDLSQVIVAQRMPLLLYAFPLMWHMACLAFYNQLEWSGLICLIWCLLCAYYICLGPTLYWMGAGQRVEADLSLVIPTHSLQSPALHTPLM